MFAFLAAFLDLDLLGWECSIMRQTNTHAVSLQLVGAPPLITPPNLEERVPESTVKGVLLAPGARIVVAACGRKAWEDSCGRRQA